MISASPISDSKSASNYFISEAKNEQEQAAARSEKVGEYYLNEQAPSVWQGAGAELQGMAGKEVDKDSLEKMLNGQVKEIKDGQITDKQLGRTGKDGQTEHRTGWDFTFSAPKSVSLESEVFGKSDVKEAHEQAVQATMKWLEQHGAGTRMGEHKEFQLTGNLTWAAFSHSTTREKDPQTHTHVLIQNLTFDKDGKAYSLESKGIYQLRALADKIYKNELANNLKSAGYAVEFDKKGGFEIQGFSKEQLDVFSKRSDQIDAYLEKQGINPEKATAEQRQIATLATRPEKDFAESREAHYEKWEREAAEHGITPAPRSETPTPRQTAQEVIQNAVGSITEREAAFTNKQLWTEITRMNEGQASLSDLKNALQSAMDKGDILTKREELTKQERDTLKNPGKEILTTRDLQTTEKAMLAQIKGQTDAVMTPDQFNRFLDSYQQQMQQERGYQLNSEQVAAARMILTGEDRHSAVQGLAGTGKTTMLEFVRKAAESNGWRVEGVSTGGNQTQKMQEESGIQGKTLASFLNSKASTPAAPPEKPSVASIPSQATQPQQQPEKALDAFNAARKATPGITAQEKDAILAQRALDTYKKDSNKLLFNMNQARFKAVKDSVDTRKIRDSQGRVYYEDKKGRVYTDGLYNRMGTPGITHTKQGLFSKTTYFKGEKGVILKQKTSRFSPRDRIKKGMQGKAEARYQKELDGRRRTETRNPGIGDRATMLMHRMDRAVSKGMIKELDKLTGGGKWEKVSGWESVFVRVKMWAGTVSERRATLAELREKATAAPAHGKSEINEKATPPEPRTISPAPPKAGKEPAPQEPGKDSNKVLVIHDEAGQAGSRDMLAFLQKVEQMGGKSVMLGDKWQFQSVAAGRAFEQMQGSGITTATLQDIRRQETQSLKDTVQQVLKGHHADALKSLPTRETRENQDAVYREATESGVDLAHLSKEERGKWEPQLKEAVAQDNQAVIQNLARDYSQLDPKNQQSTLILTSTNQARREINLAIHQQRVESGQIEKGHQTEILVRIDRTEAQATRASSYEKGEMLRHGNQMYEVAGRDTVTNTVLLKKAGSEEITRVKAETLGKAQGFTKETREFSVGDKVTFYQNDKESGIKNGQSGIITSIKDGKMTVMIGNTEKEIDLTKYRHLDYGYATTHYRAQGESVKNVMIHHDIRDGAKGNRSNYVSITRAKESVIVYANNLDQAARQVETLQDKRQALDSPMSLRKENGMTLALDRAKDDGLAFVDKQSSTLNDEFVTPQNQEKEVTLKDSTLIFSGDPRPLDEEKASKADRSQKESKAAEKEDSKGKEDKGKGSSWDFER